MTLLAERLDVGSEPFEMDHGVIDHPESDAASVAKKTTNGLRRVRGEFA